MTNYGDEDFLSLAAEKVAAIKDGLEAKQRVMQPNECPGCGSFRIDGKPPQLHALDCPFRNPRLV